LTTSASKASCRGWPRRSTCRYKKNTRVVTKKSNFASVSIVSSCNLGLRI
jgi:hypothetical protein